jgi:ribosomal protein S12 methylthiotransferase accessory factor YcaO
MATQKAVTDWLLKYRREIDLQVKELTWIHGFFPGYVDLAVSIKLGETEYSGRGTDKTEETALGKAFCESLERFACALSGISSHGVAGHFLQKQAEANAIAELVERASLFKALRGECVTLMSEQSLPFSIGSSEVDAKIRQYRLGTYEPYFVVLTLIDFTNSKKLGGILGLGCATNFDLAAFKSKIEALRNATALKSTPSEPILESDFRKILNPNSAQRRALFLGKDYFDRIIQSLNIAKDHQDFGECPRIEKNVIQYGIMGLNDSPLVFVRATSPDLFTDIEFVG